MTAATARKHEKTPSELSQQDLDEHHWYYDLYGKIVGTLSAYHQTSTVGEALQGPCIYVTHHGAGYLNMDLVIIGYEVFWKRWFIDRQPRIPLRIVAARSNIERYVPALPLLKKHFGLIDPGEASCLAVLERGEQLLVTPGGHREAQPGGNDWYRLRWENRFGFVRLALKTGAPIVPLAVVGGAQAYPGFKLGKLSFWSPMPLPAKLDIEVGEPIRVERQPDKAEDPSVVGPIHKLAWERTQALFDKLLAQRKR